MKRLLALFALLTLITIGIIKMGGQIQPQSTTQSRTINTIDIVTFTRTQVAGAAAFPTGATLNYGFVPPYLAFYKVVIHFEDWDQTNVGQIGTTSEGVSILLSKDNIDGNVSTIDVDLSYPANASAYDRDYTISLWILDYQIQ